METPEKDNFLETIRELRREADEKLTGNRHYLAIQKLDEIAEAVQQRDMSSQELGAVSNVLRGEDNEAPKAVEDEPVASVEAVDPVEPLDLAVPAVGVAGAAIAVDALTPDEPVIEVVDQQTAELDEGQALPNWWKDKDGGEGGEDQAAPEALQADPVSEVEPETVVESIEESVEESSLDLTGLATGAAVSGVAAAAIGDALSSETVETPDIAEEIELIDVPEVEIDTPDVELPAINIEAIEPEVETGEITLEAQPDVELPEIETTAIPEIAPDSEVPEFEVPEFEVAEIAPDVDAAEIAPEVEISKTLEAPELAALPEIDPEPAGLVVEQVALDDVVEPRAELPDIPVTDNSAEIADMLFDADGETQAAVAAGAAAVAIGVAGATQQDEPVVTEAPEKLSFPSVPETSDQAEAVPEPASAVPAAKILNGKNIERHPTYGGNRGGILKRFANSLRGKDYI